jgi:hypothetical protein
MEVGKDNAQFMAQEGVENAKQRIEAENRSREVLTSKLTAADFKRVAASS